MRHGKWVDGWAVLSWSYMLTRNPLTVLLWIGGGKEGREKGGRKQGEIHCPTRPHQKPIQHNHNKTVYNSGRGGLGGSGASTGQEGGNCAYLLARPQGTLLQSLRGLQLALPAVQRSQVPQGGVHRRAGSDTHTHTHTHTHTRINTQNDETVFVSSIRKCVKTEAMKRHERVPGKVQHSPVDLAGLVPAAVLPIGSVISMLALEVNNKQQEEENRVRGSGSGVKLVEQHFCVMFTLHHQATPNYSLCVGRGEKIKR